jgi:hypothetical protein
MTIKRKPSVIGPTDPDVARTLQANLKQASIIANGRPTVSQSELILPATTIRTSPTSVTLNTSANNQPSDTVTVYPSSGNVYVSSIDQTIQQNIVNQTGVYSIIAGNGVSITSTGVGGTGNVTINSLSTSLGNWEFSGGNATTSVAENMFITAQNGSGVSLNSDDWAQLYWVPDVANVDNFDPAQGGNVYNWAYVGNDGFNIGLKDQGNYDYTWTFDTDGNLTLPGNTFSVNYANGQQVQLGGGNTGNITFSGTTMTGPAGSVDSYSIYIQPSADFTNALQIYPTADNDIHLFEASGNAITLGNYSDSQISVWGPNSPNANITLQSNGNTWEFGEDGGTIFPTLTTQRGDNPSGTISGQTLLFGDNTQEAIISTPNGNAIYTDSQRLVINPGEGFAGGEGGDIYLWAGRGGPTNGSGGDIKIRGGFAPADGTGGYIRIDGGASQANGYPGYIEITGGEGGNTVGGYVEILGGQGATIGGDANLKGGYGTATGGNVNIWGGSSGNGQINEGHVNIQTGGHTWIYDASGNLALPNGGIIYETNIPGGVLTGNTIVLKPQGGTNADQQLLVYPTAIGADFNHLHLTSGNLYNTELFLGDDNLYVKLANTGNVIINSNDDNGNTAMWTFDTDGNLTLPSNTFAVNYANGTQVSLDGSNISNGNSNVSIATANGNVTIAAVGNTTMTVTGTGANITGTLNVTGNVIGGNISTIGQITSTQAGNLSTGGGQLYLNGTGNNRIDFNTNGTGAPTFTTRSAGTKVVLYPITSVTNTDYALGVGSGTLWSGIPAADAGLFFRWYAGTTEVANLSGTGILTVTGNANVGNVGAAQGIFTTSANIPIIQNGNSNVTITANANISMFVTGNATARAIFTSTGANIAGTANITGNITTGGNIGIGTSTPDAELNIIAIGQTVSYSLTGNSTTSGTDLHISGADASNTRITQDAFGTGSYVAFTGRSARGTGASPSQSQSGDTLAQFTGRGFSNGSLQFGNVSTGRLDVIAAENFTDTSRSTNVVIYTTSAGNIAPGAVATFTGTGANITGTLNVTGNITGNTNGFAIGYLNIPQVAAANTTLALTDAGKHYYSTSAGNFTLTIPNNTSVSFATGTAISIVVQSAGNVLVNAVSGVTLYMAGNSTAANRVVSNYGMATIMKVATDTWMINGTGVA